MSFLEHKKYISCFLLSFFYIFLCSLYAFDKPSLIYPEVILPSTSSLGGSYVAYQKDITILFSNPALYAFAEKNTTITAVNFRADILSYEALRYIKAKDREQKLLSLLTNTKSLCTNTGLTGPISFAFIDKNFAFGTFNTSKATAYLPSLSHFWAFFGEEIVITGGYGGLVYDNGEHEIALGVNMKGFLQTYAYTAGTVASSSLSIYEKKFEGLPVLLQAGFGLDVGFLYRFQKRISLGLTCKDLYTPVFVSYYKNYKYFFASKQEGGSRYKTFLPRLNIGFSAEAIPKGHFRNIYSLTFYIDWKDIFSFIPSIKRNYLLNFAFGGELVFHKVLSIRFGLADLYPQFGIGLDFTYFNLDFAVYGRELALKVWTRPIINIEIGIRFDI